MQQILVHVRILAHHVRLHFAGHTHRGAVCHRHRERANAQPEFKSHVSLEGSNGECSGCNATKPLLVSYNKVGEGGWTEVQADAF